MEKISDWELKRIKRAKKISIREHGDKDLFFDGCGDVYDYFSCSQTLDEHFDELEIEAPAYAYACISHQFQIAFSAIHGLIHDAIDQMHESASDEIVDENELYLFIEKWNKKQTCSCLQPNYKLVVILDEDRFKKYLAESASSKTT